MKKKRSLRYISVLELVNQQLPLKQFLVEMERLKVYVVKPGDTTNSVYYQDESRFFVTLDDEENVIGGHFA